jgi:hypothetical protein
MQGVLKIARFGGRTKIRYVQIIPLCMDDGV